MLNSCMTNVVLYFDFDHSLGNSADDKLVTFSYFSITKVLHFTQTVSFRYNVYEMSYTVFFEEKKGRNYENAV